MPDGGGQLPDSPVPSDSIGLGHTVYLHLRTIAQHQMRTERVGHSLSATALVHEAYMRLSPDIRARIGNDAGFFHIAAEAMRRILIEHARARGRLKRGGPRKKISLDAIGDVADLSHAADEDTEKVFAFEESFCRLEEHDKGVADVVRLRFFAGLTVAEVARAIDISERTVDNRWAYARAWLARDMHVNDEQEHDGECR